MKTLITGGAGFIGINAADYFTKIGHTVTIFDNLSRSGSQKNIEWLKSETNFEFKKGDIRNYKEIERVIRQSGPFDLILHLAAQVAVTTSVVDPREDFEVNTYGTFNLLEAVRQYNHGVTIIYASTNKVYGGMKDLEITEKSGRYIYKDLEEGVDEKRNLDFHSPYGCSKGAADQYCVDYYRIYGIKTIVFRQSCIYGYRQFGVEDQGWVAWFCIAVVLGRPITIYGDGKQVRDILFIDDLIRAFRLAYENRDRTVGNVYNIGGGSQNTLSLHELIIKLGDLNKKKIPLTYSDWRPGDQKVFIGNIAQAESEFGWKPMVRPDDGVKKLFKWAADNKDLFE
jgi:CDP-paratose 2-epimerase